MLSAGLSTLDAALAARTVSPSPRSRLVRAQLRHCSHVFEACASAQLEDGGVALVAILEGGDGRRKPAAKTTKDHWREKL